MAPLLDIPNGSENNTAVQAIIQFATPTDPNGHKKESAPALTRQLLALVIGGSVWHSTNRAEQPPPDGQFGP
jgi:hypothetical protein